MFHISNIISGSINLLSCLPITFEERPSIPSHLTNIRTETYYVLKFMTKVVDDQYTKTGSLNPVH